MTKKEKTGLAHLLFEQEVLYSICRDYEKKGLSSLDPHTREVYFLTLGKCLGLEIALKKFAVLFDSIND